VSLSFAITACGGRTVSDANPAGGGGAGGSGGGGQGAASSGGVSSCQPDGQSDTVFIEKEFLTFRAPDAPDPNWLLDISVTDAATQLDVAHHTLPVRFAITSDKLQMLDATPGSSAVVDAWPIRNVEMDPARACSASSDPAADWAQRPWIEVGFAKDDPSDLFPLGQLAAYSSFLRCAYQAGATSALVAGSLQLDAGAQTMQWRLEVHIGPVPSCTPSTRDLVVRFAFRRS
jgi:hypothetical protein